ncbi:MAG TPA: large-conductance mechanosensitive channel protein MscL [Burkholderiales bacterium]|nr:large-conductance mechanosensitive channel protein MscL [Burkholderiales bacterium]
MSLAKDFKDFAMKGNVVDLAVAVIIGGAFGKIVSSLVSDVVMPLIGILIGGLNFSGLSIKIGAATVGYGKFIQSCVDFLIIAWVIFIAVKLLQRLRREEPAAAAAPPAAPREEGLLEEIRDLLKQRL